MREKKPSRPNRDGVASDRDDEAGAHEAEHDLDPDLERDTKGRQPQTRPPPHQGSVCVRGHAGGPVEEI